MWRGGSRFGLSVAASVVWRCPSNLAEAPFPQSSAHKMDFTLADLGGLLKMREAPQKARKRVREPTAHKLAEVEARLAELKTLRNELALLMNRCSAGGKSCGIITEINTRQ